MSVKARVRRTIREHDMARPSTRVAVAVSGGSDSVALAHLVRELAEAGELTPAGILHFNHQLRESSGRDETFVAGIAAAFGWPFVVDREDVAARARREKRSVEDAARTARYEFFHRARPRLDADVVALGHTRDDQAETFLLRLVRGAGPRGLAAMHPRNGRIIRPLLDCHRGELRAYLQALHAPSVTDETNADVSVPRNRIRAELLPFLESRFNPAIVDVLAGEAAIAREIWEWLDGLAQEFSANISAASGIASFEVSALLHAPAALRRLVVWRAMSELARGRPVGFEHVRDALQLLDCGDDSTIDAPGQTVQRIGGRLVLRERGNRGPRGSKGSEGSGSNLFWFPLSIPGEVQLPEAGCVVSAEPAPDGAGNGIRSSATVAVVRSDVCRGGLAVRNRRPGDRFRPVGLRGRKKLQDYFVDRKVARARRDAIPIVVDDRDRIVWVAGYSIDDEFRVTDPTQGVLILRLKPGGGSV